MSVARLARSLRHDAGLSLREVADLSDLAVSTVHRVEQGKLRPTVETLERIASATGQTLALEPTADYSGSVLGLGLAIRDDLDRDDPSAIVRKAAEFVHRFGRGTSDEQHRTFSAEPPPTGLPTWDAFLGGLAEWLAATADLDPPRWTHDPTRFMSHAWWVTDMASMRAWEFAGTPVSFQRRGVFLHRESLINR